MDKIVNFMCFQPSLKKKPEDWTDPSKLPIEQMYVLNALFWVKLAVSKATDYDSVYITFQENITETSQGSPVPGEADYKVA